MTWLKDLNISDLPEQYQDIARHIGMENTIRLAEYYGKQSFYFAEIKSGKPLSEEYQEMADQIGLENTLKLARYFKGESVYFAGLEEIIRQKKREYIVRNFRGNNHEALARATNYSSRWVYEILWDERKARRLKLR